MALLKKNIRGLQDIRTLAGRVDQAAVPYKAYMKLSVLEMEKFRRGEERVSALQRVENIDTRFKEIEKEKAGLLEVLKFRGKPGFLENLPLEQVKPQPRRTGGIKIRY